MATAHAHVPLIMCNSNIMSFATFDYTVPVVMPIVYLPYRSPIQYGKYAVINSALLHSTVCTSDQTFSTIPMCVLSLIHI